MGRGRSLKKEVNQSWKARARGDGADFSVSASRYLRGPGNYDDRDPPLVPCPRAEQLISAKVGTAKCQVSTGLELLAK